MYLGGIFHLDSRWSWVAGCILQSLPLHLKGDSWAPGPPWTRPVAAGNRTSFVQSITWHFTLRFNVRNRILRNGHPCSNVPSICHSFSCSADCSSTFLHAEIPAFFILSSCSMASKRCNATGLWTKIYFYIRRIHVIGLLQFRVEYFGEDKQRYAYWVNNYSIRT